MKFLLLGLGSIGKRHCGILREMGHEVVTVDPDKHQGADYTSIDDAQSNEAWMTGILDCTPPDVRPHADLLKSFFDDAVLFVEKPLGATEAAWPNAVMMGFCYYWLPSLRRFVENLAKHRIFYVISDGGSFLPDWHEGDYRDRYHGTPGRGGVINDSLSHSLFTARWIAGDVTVDCANIQKLSGLDLRTEDCATVMLRAPTGYTYFIVESYVKKPAESTIKAVTSGGMFKWQFEAGEADEMYRCQMEVFCEVCEGKRQYGYPTLDDGIAVQRLMEGIRG